MRSRTQLAVLTAMALAPLAGCMPDGTPPPEADVNAHLASPQALRGLHRVVFVALHDESGFPTVAEGTTQALYKSVQGLRLFHVDVISRDDPVCRDVPLDKREAFDLRDLMAMREELRCDAVLFGKITNFMSYPRMQMGLYLRLLDLRAGHVLWGADHVWDMTDKAVEYRAERYFNQHLRKVYGPADSSVLLMSPSAFQRFVAHEVAQTMLPEQGEPAARREQAVAQYRRTQRKDKLRKWLADY